MAQWEICRVSAAGWKHQKKKVQGGWMLNDDRIMVDYYAPTAIITKGPNLESWGQVLAILSAAGWELVSVQHMTTAGGYPTGRLSWVHPSGDPEWEFQNCYVTAYFKRPMQAGRKIDDAL